MTNEERFWAKVNKNGPIHPYRPELGKCCLWTGGCTDRGYGNFHVKMADGSFRATRAHRYAYELKNGAIPDGLIVLHSCDRTQCCNDSHLSAGTLKQNTRDMVGRQRKATTNLSLDTARMIRNLYATGQYSQRAIAAAFFLDSHSTVGKIVRNEMWAEGEEVTLADWRSWRHSPARKRSPRKILKAQTGTVA